MAFFLLGRDHDAGDLRLLSYELFDHRRAALDALAGLVAQSAVSPDNVEVFVVDLDSAAPVLLVPSATVAADDVTEAAVEPETDAAEEAAVPEEPVSPDETPPEVVPAPDVTWSEEGPDLTDALKRAADTLESEGIVAPESIGAAESLDVGVEPMGEIEVSAEVSPEGDASDPSAWPWDAGAEGDAPTVEPLQVAPAYEELGGETILPDVASDVAAVEYVPDLLEEPAADVEGELVKTTVDDESFALSQPLIMGSYRDEEPVGDSTSEDVPTTSEPEAEADLQYEPLADLLAAGPASETFGASGDSQTCDDCVYVETCPHKDASSPATCGSFQWKAI